jgi:formylglycine-generating enzyme
VHISWQDAMAYCKWAGKRLPTEAEWELAAKTLKQNKYGWGNNVFNENAANIWQGIFPNSNTLIDGYFTTAPIQHYLPNAFGLYDMSGNVWEWCADWMQEDYYASLKEGDKNVCGPYTTNTPNNLMMKVIKGGSFLCHASYCSGYRAARRTSNSWESSSNHLGFRCVK